MKNLLLALGVILWMGWMGPGHTDEKTLYQCPMHHQIIREEPGKCPICGMTLVPIKKPQPNSQNNLQISTQQEQLMGVEIDTVRIRPLHLNISASGTVAHDPELYLAIEEYKETLQTYQNLKSPSSETQQQMQSLLRASKLKLIHLGLNEQAIAQLQNSEHSNLIVSHPGGTVWIYAQIYESEAAQVKPGQAFEVTLPGDGSVKWTGKVVAIDSFVDMETRTLKVRGQVKDSSGQLRPDSYVDVKIQIPVGKKLAVPADAVFDTGTRQSVFVQKKPGEYENRTVKLGLRGDDAVEILEGLKPGEKVAVGANFLLDSESKLRNER